MRNTVRTICGSTATTTGRPCENTTTDGRGCYLHRDGMDAPHGGGQAIGLPPVSAVQDDLSGAEVAEPVESDLAQNDYFRTAMRDGDIDERLAIARNPNAPDDVLRTAARDKDRDVRMEAAGNPNTPDDALMGLVHDEHWYVRLAAAWNPNAPDDVLRTAARDKDRDVRLTAAKHPNASESVLMAALRDEDREVRLAAAEHPNASSEEVLQIAIPDSDEYIRILVTSKLKKLQGVIK